MRKILSKLIMLMLLVCFVGCSIAKDDYESTLRDVVNEYLPDSRVDVLEVVFFHSSEGLTVKGETTLPAAKQELLTRLEGLSYKVIDSLKILPEADIDKKWAITTLSLANLRDKPRHSAQLVSQTIMGTPVKVLKTMDGWSLVQSPDNYIAWTNNSSLQFIDDEGFKGWRQSNRVLITEDSWLIDEDGNRVSDVVKGSLLELMKKKQKQVTLLLPDGRYGTMNSGNVKEFITSKDQQDLLASKLVETSIEYLGLPYLWGGTSSKAIDCSGFVKNIYWMNGYVLARDASQQIKYGQSVDLKIDSLKTGDLLFFGNREPRRVTHVAMYIGDTEFIHSAGRVKINSLDSARNNYSGYRSNSWLGAQRYIGHEGEKGIISQVRHPWYVVIN
ncbi:MAG: C40 family peptidase [Carboxylicivirga sp.]|nr:C40 family peptidase [Carboxylicivirga sp.]